MITGSEWLFFSAHFKYDREIGVIKRPIEAVENDDDEEEDDVEEENRCDKNCDLNDANVKKLKKSASAFELVFNPAVCHSCIAQSELEKYFFENKKIIVRRVENEDENSVEEQGSNSQSNEALKTSQYVEACFHNDDDDCEIIEAVVCFFFVVVEIFLVFMGVIF